jgi:hypothetical protein
MALKGDEIPMDEQLLQESAWGTEYAYAIYPSPRKDAYPG